MNIKSKSVPWARFAVGAAFVMTTFGCFGGCLFGDDGESTELTPSGWPNLSVGYSMRSGMSGNDRTAHVFDQEFSTRYFGTSPGVNGFVASTPTGVYEGTLAASSGDMGAFTGHFYQSGTRSVAPATGSLTAGYNGTSFNSLSGDAVSSLLDAALALYVFTYGPLIAEFFSGELREYIGTWGDANTPAFMTVQDRESSDPVISARIRLHFQGMGYFRGTIQPGTHCHTFSGVLEDEEDPNITTPANGMLYKLSNDAVFGVMSGTTIDGDVDYGRFRLIRAAF